MKRVVLLDVDGVIADCSTAMHALASRLFKRDHKPPPWDHYDAPRVLGLSSIEAEHFWEMARQLDWAWQIQLYPDALDGVRRLVEVADVAFCTSPWRGNASWCHHRHELLSSHFPGIDIIQTNAKHRVLGDFLVDDKVEQVEKHARWRGLLWTQRYNLLAQSDKWTRVRGWDDVIREVTR